jgi:hypothetical protein
MLDEKENKAKWCPVSIASPTEMMLDCCGERCAWWSEDAKMCSIKLLAAAESRQANTII